MEIMYLVMIAQYVCTSLNVPAIISSLSSLSLSLSKAVRFQHGDIDLASRASSELCVIDNSI